MTRPTSPPVSRGPGRPREFDLDTALAQAALVFRERGYHATAVNDLTDAMELSSGSIYKAFKDKQAIFRAAFERERDQRRAKLRGIIDARPTARDRIRDTLQFYADASCGAEGRRGCFVIVGIAELSTFDAETAQLVTAALASIEALIADLIRQGQADGSISTAIDGEVTARLMLCVLQGLRVVGKTGRSRAAMTAVAEAAMKLLD